MATVILCSAVLWHGMTTKSLTAVRGSFADEQKFLPAFIF